MQNKSRRLFIFTAMVAVLAISAGIVMAQGNGNAGNGNRGNGNAGANNTQMQLDQAQMDQFNYGGLSFVNPDTGDVWNDTSRGQMRGSRGQGNMGAGNAGTMGAGTQGTGMLSTLPPASDTPLTQEVIDLMVDGWVDEQHAYAVYEAVIAQFGEVAPFVNIQRAEAQHAASWELMFERYGIDMPALPEFEAPTFASVEEACQIAAEAEIINFSLYDDMAEAFADYPDILQVSIALRNASEFSHLPAFEACATP
jgi:hypothetical protein